MCAFNLSVDVKNDSSASVKSVPGVQDGRVVEIVRGEGVGVALGTLFRLAVDVNTTP